MTTDDAATALNLSFPIADERTVSGLLLRPARARWLLLLCHGAGAGMHHPFMTSLSQALAGVRIATLRYQFPFMEAGSRRPDRRPVLMATARAACAAAHARAPDLPLLAGGKSMGGRETSLAAAEAPLEGVRGLVFYGFPLHPAGRPGTERGGHLAALQVPLLFLQGERDRLAELDLIGPLCASLGARATLETVPGADHGFHVPRRSGRSDAEVIAALAASTARWAERISA